MALLSKRQTDNGASYEGAKGGVARTDAGTGGQGEVTRSSQSVALGRLPHMHTSLPLYRLILLSTAH